jgi:hypothetical protein
MPCLEYDQLTRESDSAMDALQFALRVQTDVYTMSRARSRLILRELAVDRHISSCEACLEERRAVPEAGTLFTI